MIHEEFSGKAIDSLEIYAQRWTPENEVKAVICLVHGMGEHSGRYEHVARFFVEKGYAFLAYDHRGHGRSKGSRGHCPTYELLLGGVSDLLNKAEELYPGKPRFLYGHSMGGNVVLNYGLRKNPDIKGIIATGPWLKLAFEPPKIQVSVGKFIGKIWPGFTQSTKLESAAISRIPEEVEKYENDPLVHDKISTAMFFSCYDAGFWALENAANMKLPVLLVHGTADRLTSQPASEEFSKKASENVKFVAWQGLFHEIHNEPEKEQVFNTMLDWLEKDLVS